MAANLIVMVLDQDNPKRGEISVIEDAHQAEQMVASLLEAGFEQERIRVFSASAVEVQVVHKPVVSFISEGTPASAEESSSEAIEDEDFASPATSEAQAPAEGDEVAVQNGVRFSSLFKSDDV